MRLLTFSVMINCMCSISGVTCFGAGWVSGRALVFIFVWWGVGAGFGIHICMVGCWGFPISLSCWFGVMLGKII